MPNKLPVLSGKEIIRTLEVLGFRIAHRKSSHIIMRKGSRTCTVPDHKEVGKGTFLSVLDQAGITRAEFLAAYYKMKKRKSR